MDPVKVYLLDPGEECWCYSCGERAAVLAGPDHPPLNANANYVCLDCLAPWAVVCTLIHHRARRTVANVKDKNFPRVTVECGAAPSFQPGASMKDGNELLSKQALHWEKRWREAKEQQDKLIAIASKFRDAFTYDPGHSDMDNEQPIHVRVTLGDWRRLNYVLRMQYANSIRDEQPRGDRRQDG